MSLSTHVLDATTGRPAVGVGILLESFRDGGWAEVATGLTDDDGRLKEWLPDDLPGIGTHRRCPTRSNRSKSATRSSPPHSVPSVP